MRALGLVLVVALVGCGGSAAFRLTSDDNDPDQLRAALERRQLGGGRGPIATDQHARVFAVVSGQPRRLVAFDLTEGRTAWAVDADVTSRVVVGGDFVAAVEGTDLVARAQADGAVRWRQPVGGALGGLAADEERVFVVRRSDDDGAPRSWLTARSGRDGSALWAADADGALGAPAAQGGLVFSPFLKQWLSVLDARTGAQLARIRGVDEEIGFVRADSDGAWFGSPQGVFRVDELAATGRRDEATYGRLPLPKQLAQARYAPDGYDPVQTAYTASDRAHILWRASPGAPRLAWQDDGFAVHYFRFVIGYDTAGAMRWAYSHPRVELIASAHLGSVLLGVGAGGEVVALDPASGGLRHQASIDLGVGQVLGAAIDADGWTPPGGATGAADTVAALASIARDRDRRFEKIKELAIGALAQLPGAEVTADLLALLDDARTSDKLKDLVGDVLVTRKDPGGLPALLAALGRRDDFVDGTSPGPVGVLARAVGGLGSLLDDRARAEATAALAPHLRSPVIDLSDLVDVIAALGAVGGVRAAEELRAHLLMYRVDAELAGSPEWATVVTAALAGSGAAQDRETLRFVGADARTEPTLAAIAAAAARP